MNKTDKSGHTLDRLTNYQSMARRAVLGWSVYITYYAVAFILIALTMRNDSGGISSLLLGLSKDPAIWGIVLMPPLFMIFLRWSVMDLATRLHNLDSDQTPIEQALFDGAESFSEPTSESTMVGEAFELHSLLQNMADIRDAVTQRKKIRVSIDIHSDVPKNVAGQPVILQSVLNELFDNAVQRTKEGEIYINAKVLEQSHGKLLLRFEVGDSGTGDGISVKHMHHFQELLAAVGGQISEHNKKGSGQTVWFTMMLQKRHKQTAVA